MTTEQRLQKIEDRLKIVEAGSFGPNPNVHPQTIANLKTYLGSSGSSSTATGLATRLLGAGAGTQTIAHGFGAVPTFLTITGFSGTGSTLVAGTGSYDGTNQQFSTLYGVATPDWGTGDILQFSDGGGNTIQAVATLDATNITLTWTVTGSNTFTAQFHFIWIVT